MKAIITGANEIPVATPTVVELDALLHAPKLETDGYLSDTGWQYSAYVDTTTADVYVTVAEFTVEPPLEGDLIQAIFELTASIKDKTAGTGDITVKWEAKNKAATIWVLLSAVAYADVNTTYLNKTVRGIVMPVANFNKVPFMVRLQIKCNEVNEGRGRVAHRTIQYGAAPGSTDYASVVRFLQKAVS